jgi:glycosyltransferase involved in cell wall biosynthesis
MKLVHRPSLTPGEPIRVMRIIARLNIGGPAIHVFLLTAGINGPEFSSTLVTGHIGPDEGDMSYLAGEYGVNPIFVRGLGRDISPLDDLRAFFALLRLMRRERPHVVHTHTAKAGFLGRITAALCGVPVIVHTFHGHVFWGYFGPTKTRLFMLLEQAMARVSTVILTISDRLRDDLIRFRIAPADKIQVVALGLDLDSLAPLDHLRGQLRRELGVDPAAPLVGIVGRLVPIKNHELFLASARLVIERVPEARFVIVGDGERRAELEALVEQIGLSEVVFFVGWRRDLTVIYADLDILALTSDNEGTPVSIIEAMAAQVPVIATEVGGVPDLLQNGELGRMIPTGDSEALAEALVRMIKSGKEPIRLRKAQQVALEIYSAQRLVAELEELYRALLERAGVLAKDG